MARALARHVTASLRIRRAQRIACYLANDGEIDLAPVVAFLRNLGREVLLPALHDDGLWFFPYSADTPMKDNRFGIPEPCLPPRVRCPARELDVVLMPLVAVDSSGNRLGMGGGYYDRTFSYLKARSVWKRPLLIGVAYEFQRVARLPTQPWDIPLHALATEKQLYHFR